MSLFAIPTHHHLLSERQLSQLDLFNISQSSYLSDDSDPGSPACSSHGGRPVTSNCTAGQGRLVAASFDPGSQSTSTWPTYDVPYLPRHYTHAATSYNSANRSISSPFGHLGDGCSPDSYSPGSPSSSYYSHYSNDGSEHGVSDTSPWGYDPDATQRHHIPYSQIRETYHSVDRDSVGLDHTGCSGYAAQPRYYQLQGHGGYSGVLAPDEEDIKSEPDQGYVDIPSATKSPIAVDSPIHSSQPATRTAGRSSSNDVPNDNLISYQGEARIHAKLHSSIRPPVVYPSELDITNPEAYLRQQLRIPRHKPVDLSVVPQPANREKPNYPYPELMKLAIFGSPRKALTLQGIYEALIDRFEWFQDRADEAAWKNSIRHNLSLNQVFQNKPRPITEPGKGSYWVLDISKGEGYKRPRIRKTRAEKREAAAQAKAAMSTSNLGTPTPTETRAVTFRMTQTPKTSGSKSSTSNKDKVGFATDSEDSPARIPFPGSSPVAGSPIDDNANIDPALRGLDQGHIVGQGRLRSRRDNRSSPYPQRKCSYLNTQSGPSSLSHMTVPNHQTLAPLQIPVQCEYPEVPVVDHAQACVQSQRQGSFEPLSGGQSSLELSSAASSSGSSSLSLNPYSSATSPASVASLVTPDTEYIQMVTDGGIPRARRVSLPSGTSLFASPGHGIRVLSGTPTEMRFQEGSYDGGGTKRKARA